ncbi:MAG: NusG domain II-containing protein [Treponemataceae bacterium]|nr:NusG domain II-containing protein [Treponemataceae bacterium]
MKQSRTRFLLRPLDGLVVLLSVIGVGFAFWVVYEGAQDNLQVVIEASGSRWVYPLSSIQHLAIPGPLGTTFVEIHQGEAYISDSPCPDKLCVAMGKLKKAGDWAACLPNRVFVRIAGNVRQDGIDASSW